jgi:hypothetical protein
VELEIERLVVSEVGEIEVGDDHGSVAVSALADRVATKLVSKRRDRLH